jgi:hypothetical protein
MKSIYLDATIQDEERRRLLYQGELFVYSPTPSSKEFCEFAQELSAEAFAPHDPKTAQFALTPEEYAAVLATLKPSFIHHKKSKALIQSILKELGCDLQKTYFDVPRLRTATSNNFLTSGLAYAFHPHRDTWYSAPQCQINWWLPVYEITPANCMAFHLKYWDNPVKNSSRDYNYYRWNKESRSAAATQIRSDARKQPQAEEPMELDPEIRLVCPVGGIILFAGAHMHSTVPNDSGYTRFSIDFRTVNEDDVNKGIGAPNLDSKCTGTSLRDFLRSTDLTRLPEDIVRPYDTEPVPDDAVLIYEATKRSPARRESIQ